MPSTPRLLDVVFLVKGNLWFILLGGQQVNPVPKTVAVPTALKGIFLAISRHAGSSHQSKRHSGKCFRKNLIVDSKSNTIISRGGGG